MVKLPVIERFRITCETSAADMGPLIAQLTRMGLTNVSFELVNEAQRYARNVKPDGVNGEDYARAWVKDHPTFRAIELVEHFRQNGRSDGVAYTSIRLLVEGKVIRKVGPGNYARTDVKQLAKPKKVSHGATVLRYAAKHPSFSSIEIKKHFDKIGRPRDSVSTTLFDLTKQKKIKQLGAGAYRLINGVEVGHG